MIAWFQFRAVLQMRVYVLDHDGRVIDQDADRERKAAQGHDVDCLAQARTEGKLRRKNCPAGSMSPRQG